MSKIIVVFGATGNQGGSVIKAILADSTLSEEYKIRAADLDSKESLISILKGAHAVFLVTNYWETRKAEVEIAQGKNVAEAAKEAGVQQIIFSSLVNVTKVSNGKLKHVIHFDSKAQVEDYIRGMGITCTFVQPGYFMSNFGSQLNKGEDGSYKLAFPLDRQAKFPLVDIAEYGRWVVPALKHPDVWNTKRIHAAAEYYTIDQIIADFEQVTGSKVNYTQATNEQYMSFLPPYMAEEMLENHLLIGEPGYYGGESLKESQDALDSKVSTWKEFVARTWK